MKLTEETKRTLKQEIYDFMKECREKEHPESFLIGVLHKVQEEYGYLSRQHMQEVAEAMEIPAATVSGVASFYHFFRLTPIGKYKISICMGTACYVKGAEEIVEAFKEHLNIENGETSADGLFTLELTRCLGVCGQAPVAMINDRIHGNLSKTDIPVIVQNIKNQEKSAS